MGAWRLDTDLALRLAEVEARAQDGASAEPGIDEVVDSIPVYDESRLPDPFAKLPAWAEG